MTFLSDGSNKYAMSVSHYLISGIWNTHVHVSDMLLINKVNKSVDKTADNDTDCDIW